MTALRQRLLDVFETEYREHSEAIRRMVSEAELSDGFAAGFNHDETTRRAHTLKGAARAVGLEAVESLVHELESLFVLLQRGDKPFDRETRGAIFKALDEIEDRIAGAQEGAQPPARVSANSAVAAADIAKADTADQPQAAQRAHGTAGSDLVRVNADDLDQLLKSAGELHADMLFQNLGAQELHTVSARMTMLERHWADTLGRPASSIRPAVPGAAGGDVVAAQFKALSKSLRLAAQRQAQVAKALRHHLEELERRVMAARMVPAESVFGSFRKMVRDVAASEGKEVELTVEGLECEADRLVLQRIKDPVMHILRNAVSHGIEAPAERQAAGKEPQGRVSLSLSAETGRLRFVIEDDGRGLDVAGIARKAVERNLLSRDEAERAGPQALARLLFEAGFSTSANVTTISGRGVGLSVAHETVVDLQGSIEIGAATAGGTRVDLVLPVSILTRRLLLVSLKEQVFAIPCEFVARVMQVPLSDIATIEGRPVARFKQDAVPLTSIGELLELGPMAVTAGARALPVVILRKGTSRLGVAVDAFVGVNEFVVRHFDNGSPKRRRWMGLITTEHGAPCLVLNPEALLAGDAAARAGGPVFDREKASPTRQQVILVVDDSITTRTLEKSILEAHGYRVRLSVDGRDALIQLRTETPDVVISDIEMPHMGGFELLQAMKAEPRIADVPVILVTSRSTPADRERGLRLGADAYVVKQKFDQDELLRTIRQVI